MPLSQKVTIRYGPYESCGVVDYRTSRLIGLKTMLEDNGHSWVEEQSPDWNIVELVVNGEIVFTCKITDLDFVNKTRYLASRLRELLMVHHSY
ncbi:UPF0728 protein C10orf53 homolog isoform X2 [Hemitrygon akajei]|uniref:UPF0728 protein C10orf53 homolog isoform X2 n=1 Tax=Hemitrygon akajei TaxID=2704970 RepID=UPI003BF9CD54